MTSPVMEITVVHIGGCPHWQDAMAVVARAVEELGLDATISAEEPTGVDGADLLSFAGSPTILVGGVDLFPVAHTAAGLTCRLYRTPSGPSGAPTGDQVRAAIEQLA